ncbi:MAG: NAD-dependent protein deacylase [Phycisphaerae bacterium]|nr:NAD-dependent protein deacylase [Phycisphaerae bacterium]
MSAPLQQAARALSAATNVCVLTGAGVSAESGVPTFRGLDGLWKNFRPEEVSNPDAFARDPALVWEWYNMRRDRLGGVEPNPGHHAIAEIERRVDRFTLVTQNVDGLHAAAGSRNVLEVHGNIWRTLCTGCGRRQDRTGERLDALPACPACGALLRPDVVWFGEMLDPDLWDAAVEAVRSCDLFLSVGTSAVVYPAAGLLDAAAGAVKIEVNVEPTPASARVDIALAGRSGQLLPLLARQAFGLGD